MKPECKTLLKELLSPYFHTWVSHQSDIPWFSSLKALEKLKLIKRGVSLIIQFKLENGNQKEKIIEGLATKKEDMRQIWYLLEFWKFNTQVFKIEKFENKQHEN